MLTPFPQGGGLRAEGRTLEPRALGLWPCRRWVFYSTVNGTDTLVVAHAIARRPPAPGLVGSMVNVSCSTLSGSVSFCIGTLPTSVRERCAVWKVSHSLLKINVQTSSVG